MTQESAPIVDSQNQSEKSKSRVITLEKIENIVKTEEPVSASFLIDKEGSDQEYSKSIYGAISNCKNLEVKASLVVLAIEQSLSEGNYSYPIRILSFANAKELRNLEYHKSKLVESLYEKTIELGDYRTSVIIANEIIRNGKNIFRFIIEFRGNVQGVIDQEWHPKLRSALYKYIYKIRSNKEITVEELIEAENITSSSIENNGLEYDKTIVSSAETLQYMIIEKYEAVKAYRTAFDYVKEFKLPRNSFQKLEKLALRPTFAEALNSITAKIIGWNNRERLRRTIYKLRKR
ncbi:MAG: hypothetical protein WCK31_02500 [bacterium]